MRMLCTISLLTGLITSGLAAASPELLVEASALSVKRSAPDWVIVDVRSDADYAREHIPGAVHAEHDRWAKWSGEPNGFADADAWSKRIADLGISNDKTVVVYDADTGKSAARIWFLLSYWSVRDVRLLNGGFKAWKADGLPTESKPPVVTPTDFRARAGKPLRTTLDGLKTSLSAKSCQVLDVRSDGEYEGTRKLARRGGHVPGATHLEWSRCLDETGKFKSSAELKALFKSAGISADTPIVTYCQSGGRASHMLFALKLAGFENVQNYYSSWREWGNAPNTPIE